jgi:hypothetical protein
LAHPAGCRRGVEPERVGGLQQRRQHRRGSFRRPTTTSSRSCSVRATAPSLLLSSSTSAPAPSRTA